MLGQRIAARQPPPTCLPELRRALLDEWCNIPQDQIDNLILSMPRRFHDMKLQSSQLVFSNSASPFLSPPRDGSLFGHSLSMRNVEEQMSF
ncbi:transposable element Tcb2 transposase [Trichonephila clavipes]|nr:transposable element Tcb2 transposase [Trichonephila clavipes]